MVTWMAVCRLSPSRSAAPWEALLYGHMSTTHRRQLSIFVSEANVCWFRSLPRQQILLSRPSTWPQEEEQPCPIHGDCSIPALVASCNIQRAWLNSVEQSPWDADRSAASQEIPCRILCFVDRAAWYNSCKWPTWRTIFFSYMFIPNLYMFRALMCSSSGELIVSIHLVYVYVGDR